MVKTVCLVWLTVILCLGLVEAEVKEFQIKLEDIEQDNLSGEKILQPQIIQQQQQPLQRVGTLQNLPPRQYFATATAPPPPPPAPTANVPPQESTGPHQFSPDARQFPPAPPLQVQFPNRIPQQQLVIATPVHGDFLQYLAQPRIGGGHEQQYQFQFVPSDNNNNLIQDPYLQQYFTQSNGQQQYVFVQPQASHNVPVQAKPQNLGGIQYVQYLDPSTELLRNPQTHSQLANHHHKSSHNLAGLLQRYAHTNTLPLNYRQPAPQTYRQQGQPQPLINQNVYVVPQVTQPVNAPLQPIYQHQVQPQRQSPQVLGQQRFLVPGITYVRPQYQQPQFQRPPQYQPQQYQPPPPPPPQYQQQEAQQSIANIVYEKRAPKSLLDSYVPSVLQIQYIKQLQEQQKANALRTTAKLNENIGGKVDYPKNVQVQQESEESSAPSKETVYEIQYQ